MPRIKGYESRVENKGGVTPGRAVPSGLGMARGLQQVGDSVSALGDVVFKRKEQSEISDLSGKMAEAHATYTAKMRETLRTADPGDETIVEGFVKDYDDNVGKLGDDISTPGAQEYFARSSAQMRGHFMESAAAGQAELAGAKAKQDYVGALGNFGSSLINDPSSYDMVKKLHDDGLDARVKSGGMSVQVAGELKQRGGAEIAKASVRGWIRLNPEHAKKEIASGRWDGVVDGDLKHQLFGEADQAIRARETEDGRVALEQKRLREEQNRQVQSDMLTRLAAGTLKTEDVLTSPLEAFGSGSKEQFLQLLKSRNGADDRLKTDPGVFMDTWERIHLPDGDPKKIVDENDLNPKMGRGLSPADVVTLRNEMSGKRTQEGGIEAELKKGVVDIARGMLTRTNPMLGMRDPVGDEQQQKFMAFFLREYAERRKAGKTALELLSPESPDYLGKYARQYARTPQQIMKDLSRFASGNTAMDLPSPPTAGPDGLPSPTPAPSPSAAPARPPRNDGESAADYLKRVGG